LPSAADHRPLNFEELEYMLTRNEAKTYFKEGDKRIPFDINIDFLKERAKHKSKTIFLSATPAAYELEIADKIVEQIIRPTGLLDPITYVYPKS